MAPSHKSLIFTLPRYRTGSNSTDSDHEIVVRNDHELRRDPCTLKILPLLENYFSSLIGFFQTHLEEEPPAVMLGTAFFSFAKQSYLVCREEGLYENDDGAVVEERSTGKPPLSFRFDVANKSARQQRVQNVAGRCRSDKCNFLSAAVALLRVRYPNLQIIVEASTLLAPNDEVLFFFFFCIQTDNLFEY